MESFEYQKLQDRINELEKRITALRRETFAQINAVASSCNYSNATNETSTQAKVAKSE